MFSSPAWSASWQPSSPGSPSTASLTTTSVWRESSLTGQYYLVTVTTSKPLKSDFSSDFLIKNRLKICPKFHHYYTHAIICYCRFQYPVIQYFNKQLITSGLNL